LKQKKGNVKVTKICRQCGKPFEVYQCHIDFDRRRGTFCSTVCKAQWQSEHCRSENHPRWKGGKVKRSCQICGKEFYIKPKDLKQKGGGNFCSYKCAYKARQLKLLWNNPILRKDVIEKIKAHWQDLEYRERVIRNTLKGLFKRPTSLEKQFIGLIQKYSLPYRYTGDGSFLIGFKNPDFVNTNGAKICIEVTNPYYHDIDWADKRINHFKKYGWDCFIFFSEGKKLNDKEIIAELGIETATRGITT